MDLDLGHFVHAQDPIVTEVRLLHTPVFQRNPFPQGSGESQHYAALHLRAYRVRIHGGPAIKGAHDLVDMDFAAPRHLDFRNHREVAPEGKLQGDDTTCT